MTSLLDRLLSEHVLLCSRCRAPQLALDGNACRCGACGARWPVQHGVPDLFNKYDEPATAPSTVRYSPAQANEAVVERIRTILELEDSDAMRQAIDGILYRSATLRSNESALSAEINDVLDRFVGGEAPAPGAPARDANTTPNAAFVRHYLRSEIGAGRPFSFNVRIRNAGGHALSSRVKPAAEVCASWAGERGFAASTRLPIDLEPGRSITLPLRLKAPRREGAYTVRISLAVGGKVVQELAALPVRCVDADRLARAEVTGSSTSFDYAADHRMAYEMLESVLAERSAPRVLEVGCGTHPQAAWIGHCEVVGLDVSAPLLELGALYFRDRFPHRFTFVCADATEPPFAPGSFDCVTMFSALHHFPEPDALLAALRGLLRPGGFLAVMCEPVGDSLEDPVTIRDLTKGINEQVFSLDEYRLIFERAGLAPQRLQLDGGSLKAILVPT